MLEKPARTKTLAYYEHSSITYVRKKSHNIGPLVLYYPDNPYLFVKKAFAFVPNNYFHLSLLHIDE